MNTETHCAECGASFPIHPAGYSGASGYGMKSAPFDFIATGDFNSTVVSIAPNTDRARDFFRQMFGCAGVAPVSIEMPKTKFSDFEIFASRKGYTVA